MYFYYGITHSTLENPEEEIELKVDQNTYASPTVQVTEQTAVWDRHGYENRMAEETSNSWSVGGCWNAGNTINQGWGAADQPTISVNSHQSSNGSRSSNSHSSSKKPSASTKGSSSSATSKAKSSKAAPPAKKPTTSASKSATKPTAGASSTTTTTQQQSAGAAATAQSAPKKDGFGLFVQETEFPTWDD